MNPIDIISPLKALKATADSLEQSTSFADGYRLAINHALELALVLQARINMRLGAE